MSFKCISLFSISISIFIASLYAFILYLSGSMTINDKFSLQFHLCNQIEFVETNSSTFIIHFKNIDDDLNSFNIANYFGYTAKIMDLNVFFPPYSFNNSSIKNNTLYLDFSLPNMFISKKYLEIELTNS